MRIRGQISCPVPNDLVLGGMKFEPVSPKDVLSITLWKNATAFTASPTTTVLLLLYQW